MARWSPAVWLLGNLIHYSLLTGAITRTTLSLLNEAGRSCSTSCQTVGRKANNPVGTPDFKITLGCRPRRMQVLSRPEKTRTVVSAKSNNPSPATNQTPVSKRTSENTVTEVGSFFTSLTMAMQLTELTVAAGTLNDLSNQLSKEVSAIEGVVNELNLGIRTEVHAVTLRASDPGAGDHYSHWLRLAYGKAGARWGFIIEELTEDITNPEGDSYQSWFFQEAPREFRLKVVEKIPALIEALVKKS